MNKNPVIIIIFLALISGYYASWKNTKGIK